MVPTNNLFIAFLKELFLRFSTKSPKFFKIFQLISGVCAAVTGIPEVLTSFGVHLSPELMSLQNKAVAYASMGVLFTSLMTTQSKPAATQEDGTILKKTDENKLPFTAANEVNIAAKMEDSKPVVVEAKKPDEEK